VAKKHGGAWKVAYADFVTAMMAFFLVMWLCAQNQGVREAVGEYFNDPLGVGKKPGKVGAIFDKPTNGSLPNSESVALGHGRKSHTHKGEAGPTTKLISDWLNSNERAAKTWRREAQLAREAARNSKEVLDKKSSLKDAAVRHLAKQLREEITLSIPPQATGLYEDLIFRALGEVNWLELAEDLLAQN
jgi:flagellar motor protein MotB